MNRELQIMDNPLDDDDATRAQTIRERAYHLWEADGRPDGRDTEFWERARALIGMEASAGAGQLRNPAVVPGADPYAPTRVEEAAIQENLGEFPDRLADQGERKLFPAKANRKRA
jgi:hypothetical protein